MQFSFHGLLYFQFVVEHKQKAEKRAINKVIKNRSVTHKDPFLSLPARHGIYNELSAFAIFFASSSGLFGNAKNDNNMPDARIVLMSSFFTFLSCDQSLFIVLRCFNCFF